MKRTLIAITIYILAATIGVGIVNLQNDKITSLTNEGQSDIIQNIDIELLQAEVREQRQANLIEIPIKSIDVPTPIPASRGDNKKYTKITAIVTAYAPYDTSGICNDGSPDTTATGTKPKFGTLAANPKLLPYGTKILIKGYGVGTVEDTGGALLKDDVNIRIDLYMDTYEEAIAWGRQKMTVYIIE